MNQDLNHTYYVLNSNLRNLEESFATFSHPKIKFGTLYILHKNTYIFFKEKPNYPYCDLYIPSRTIGK